MKLNDMTKAALLCGGMLVLMAIAGTCDYRDAVHYSRPDTGEMTVRESSDTVESAYDVMRYVENMEKKPQ